MIGQITHYIYQYDLKSVQKIKQHINITRKERVRQYYYLNETDSNKLDEKIYREN